MRSRDIDRALASPDLESVSGPQLAEALGICVTTVYRARHALGLRGRQGTTNADLVRESILVAPSRDDGAVKLSEIVDAVRAVRPEMDRPHICGHVRDLVGIGELERVEAGWYRPVHPAEPGTPSAPAKEER